MLVCFMQGNSDKKGKEKHKFLQIPAISPDPCPLVLPDPHPRGWCRHQLCWQPGGGGTVTSSAALQPPAQVGMRMSAGRLAVPGRRVRPSLMGAEAGLHSCVVDGGPHLAVPEDYLPPGAAAEGVVAHDVDGGDAGGAGARGGEQGQDQAEFGCSLKNQVKIR